MQKFEIPIKLPGANEFIQKSYSNRHKGNNIKQHTERDIFWCIKKAGLKRIKRPIFVRFIWYEGNKTETKTM